MVSGEELEAEIDALWRTLVKYDATSVAGYSRLDFGADIRRAVVYVDNLPVEASRVPLFRAVREDRTAPRMLDSYTSDLRFAQAYADVFAELGRDTVVVEVPKGTLVKRIPSILGHDEYLFVSVGNDYDAL
jgi:hypothetical protein